MDQPVKTYSSGMFMRLAFAVATCVEPDVLLIDEALSVGDGAFARKSFDRIMKFKNAGRTIVFCSHSLYQVEAICDRAIWLDQGRLCRDGAAAEVIAAYNSFMNTDALQAAGEQVAEDPSAGREPLPAVSGSARLHRVTVQVDGEAGRRLVVRSGSSEVCIEVEFVSDREMPAPSVAVAITQMDGRIVSSAGTHNDGWVLERDRNGRATVRVCFPRIPLLKGTYGINVYLLCEQGIHCYEHAAMVAELSVMQVGLEQGVVSLEHRWDETPAPVRAQQV